MSTLERDVAALMCDSSERRQPVTPVFIRSSPRTGRGYSFAGTGEGRVFRSTDSGQSWLQTGAGLIGSSMQQLVVDSLRGTLYVRTIEGEVFRSINDGQTWRQAATELASSNVQTLVISQRDGRPRSATIIVGTVVTRRSSMMRGFVSAMKAASRVRGIAATVAVTGDQRTAHPATPASRVPCCALDRVVLASGGGPEDLYAPHTIRALGPDCDRRHRWGGAIDRVGARMLGLAHLRR